MEQVFGINSQASKENKVMMKGLSSKCCAFKTSTIHLPNHFTHGIYISPRSMMCSSVLCAASHTLDTWCYVQIWNAQARQVIPWWWWRQHPGIQATASGAKFWKRLGVAKTTYPYHSDLPRDSHDNACSTRSTMRVHPETVHDSATHFHCDQRKSIDTLPSA